MPSLQVPRRPGGCPSRSANAYELAVTRR
jgi:hypothetical protein